MRWRLTRLSVAAALLAMTGLVGLSAGTAAAAEPIVVGDCAATIQGTPGQPIALRVDAVLAPVVNVVRAVPLLGPPLASEVDKALRKLPPIVIGAIPDGKGGFITGGQIANTIVAELRKIPLLGPIIGEVVKGVQQVLSLGCGVTVTVANAVAAPVQDGTKALADGSELVTKGLTGNNPAQPPSQRPGKPADPGLRPNQPAPQHPGQQPNQPAPQQPAGPGYQAVGGIPMDDFQLFGVPGINGNGRFDFGRVPLYDYSGLPITLPGGLGAPAPGVRYGQQVPGYAPQFSVLGAGPNKPPDDGVAAAGQATALPADGSGRIAAPVLLAVLILSMVTAALVRTWVLRRAAATA